MNIWISVDDKLPPGNESVLVYVYIPKTAVGFISTNNFILGENCFLFDKYTDATVTHWMPLPQPPTRK